MADIVNLNQYRKRRDRRDAEKTAAQNRTQHGMTKAEREKLRRETERNAKGLDDKKLD